MKVITFSRNFPATHPRKGEPTNFVEKIWQSIYLDNVGSYEFEFANLQGFDIGLHDVYEPKNHTIRGGNRWKEGEYFSPRVWSGKPYASKQIQFAPPIQIKKLWDIELLYNSDKTELFFLINGKHVGKDVIDFNVDDFVKELASNDGLNIYEFLNWFPTSFKGQILCWNDSIDYSNYINP
jgi:hypothetical protein